MKIDGRPIWQQACGDKNRNYSWVCIRWGVILNGPGYRGAYPDCLEVLAKDGVGSRKRTDLWRFAEKMQEGDIVILKLGTDLVFAVGQVVGGYEWNEAFSDIDGWDLQHIRRVRWVWGKNEGPEYFGAHELKWGDTTQTLISERVKSWVRQLEIQPFESELPKLPQAGARISQQKIAESLFAHGVASQSINGLLMQFGELIRIATWYHRSRIHPTEAETRSYLVIPLLRALGWTPQRAAIEWNHVDVALFRGLPRIDENLSCVVEIKRNGYSCLNSKSQAEGYALGKRNCGRLIVTDGLRYGTFVKDSNGFKLRAYFNLLELRNSYPVYDCLGVTKAMKIMTPGWVE